MDNFLARNKALKPYLNSSSVLKEQTENNVKSLSSSLMLTPLVDAFAILVIYLLVNTSAAQHQILIDGSIQLPQASQTKNIEDGILVKVKQGNYFIEDRSVSSDRLVFELRKVMAKQDAKHIPFLIVEADKNSEFVSLSPIMIAGSSAGFEKIKLAVVQGGAQ